MTVPGTSWPRVLAEDPRLLGRAPSKTEHRSSHPLPPASCGRSVAARERLVKTVRPIVDTKLNRECSSVVGAIDDGSLRLAGSPDERAGSPQEGETQDEPGHGDRQAGLSDAAQGAERNPLLVLSRTRTRVYGHLIPGKRRRTRISTASRTASGQPRVPERRYSRGCPPPARPGQQPGRSVRAHWAPAPPRCPGQRGTGAAVNRK